MNRVSNNDFTKQEVKVKSKYKLWVKYHKEYTNEKLKEIKVYYSYEKAGNAKYGYNKLMSLLRKNRSKIKVAILYDNLTSKELEIYSF